MQTDKGWDLKTKKQKRHKCAESLQQEATTLSYMVGPPLPPAGPDDPCREQQNAIDSTKAQIASITALVDTLPGLIDLLDLQEDALAQCRIDNPTPE